MLHTWLAIFAAVICGTCTGALSWGICPEIDRTLSLDLEKAKGSWYLYAWIPSQWSTCHNYTIFQNDTNGDFQLKEEYLSAVLKKPSSSFYSVEYEINSNELKLTSKIMNIIPETTSWKVIEVDYNDFMLLHKCNMIAEESQLWVRNPELTIDLEETPAVMAEAMQKLNLRPTDYNLKRNFHCL